MRTLGLAFLLLLLPSCRLATKNTPDYYVKPVVRFQSPEATRAAGFFWHVFQRGDYSHADLAFERLYNAYQTDPTDARLVELAGLCRFWQVVEHGRTGTPSAATYPMAAQSYQLLSEAQQLDPGSRLIPAFVNTAQFELGAIQKDGAMMSQAATQLRHNTTRYPKFHGFVEGWVLTAMLPPDNPCYDEAIDAYFETLDSCAGIRIPRFFPKIGPIGLSLVAKESKCETACYNSNFAPHNLEGTFLGLGDALVKKGDFRRAKIVYESIKNVGTYKHWPYKHVLEHRLCNMKSLRQKFVADSGCTDVSEPAMLYQSSISCSACHATNSPTISYDMASPSSGYGYDEYNDYGNYGNDVQRAPVDPSYAPTSYNYPGAENRYMQPFYRPLPAPYP